MHSIKIVEAVTQYRGREPGFRVECTCGSGSHESKVLPLRVAEEVASAHKWGAHRGDATVEPFERK
jgi:hypothetical protein